MSDEYLLSEDQSRLCRWLSRALGLAALIQAGSIIVAMAAPAFLAIRISCGKTGCAVVSAPFTVLPERLRFEVSGRTDAIQLLQTHLDLPATRLELVAAEVLISLPMTGLLVAAAVALFELSRRQGHDLRRAFPWLRRSAGFALASVLLMPIGESLRSTAFSQAFSPATRLYLSLESETFVLHLLLALVALAVTWALAAGMRAEQDIAEIV